MSYVTPTSESRIRSQARRHGFKVRKSRAGFSIDNLGDFMLIEVDRNIIVLGERFDASLDDIADYLAD